MPVAKASRKQAEQIIAVSRLGLAASSIFAIWVAPVETSRSTDAYLLLSSYVAFGALTLMVPFTRRAWPQLVVATHVVDVLFSALQYLVLGPSSPLFMYFVFCMFSSALRWGWKGALVTSTVILVLFLLMTALISVAFGPAPVRWNIVVLRVVQLAMSAGMLVYLLRYGARLRSEIERLARWPVTVGASAELATGRVVSHACRILNAASAVIIWESDERSAIQIASWSAHGLRLSERPPSDLSPLLPDALALHAFLVTEDVGPESTLTTSDGQGRLVEQ